MRLYDELLAARGGLVDRLMLGAVTIFGKMLEEAQCFTISAQIAGTCTQVCYSKPSSILSALDMTRTPYPLTWIEWLPSVRMTDVNMVDNGKPIPSRVGALLMTNKAGSKGHMALAWVHHDPEPAITLNPLGLIFDWDSQSTDPVLQQYARSFGIDNSATVAIRRAALADPSVTVPGRWAHHRSPEERAAILDLEMRAEIVPLEFCCPFLQKHDIGPDHHVYENYCNDLSGELPFIEAFLLLLNSRNSIVEQKRDDFTKLNRARARNRKPPLKEFINTTIKFNRVQANRAGETHAERLAARKHMVRGHFKLKYGKLWWWSPHPRGRGTVTRTDYKVT